MSTLTAAEPRVRTVAPPRSDERRIRRLGRYAAIDTVQTREIVRLQRPDGSTLVIDWLSHSRADARVVAQLAPEEPVENADIVVQMYLADASRGHCRLLTGEDLTPAPQAESPGQNGGTAAQPAPLHDAEGHIYRIRELAVPGSASELRWTRSCHPGVADPFQAVRLRDVVGALQAYEPARTITAHALAVHREGALVSVCRLAGELERLACSPIVLNRGLREAVHSALARGDLSMSEIAMRCGRMKRDSGGKVSGETSWLARRIGALPEGGAARPTPWVHSDVLALISRDGLAMSPNQVEL
jgi:hypothetical protein